MAEWPVSVSFIIPPHSESFALGRKLAPENYLDRLAAYADAAVQAGVLGAFVYDFPVALDPWLAAFDVMSCSATLEPIVAVRPHLEAAESVARRVADLQYRFGHPAHVNLVAGATRASRAAGDLDDRVGARQRMAGFATDLRAELDRRLEPTAARSLVFTPSSSTPGRVPVDCVLLMAKPRDVLAGDIQRIRAEQQVDRIAMLVGLVVRRNEDDAWAATADLHPPDRRQEVAGRLFMSQVVSSEHETSYALANQRQVHDDRLWFGAPARGIDAPKLVGTPGQVRDWLGGCQAAGVTDLIIDLLPDPAEYTWVREVLTA